MNIQPHGHISWQWLLAAALPCIALIALPSFWSPFLGAKTALLLVLGAVSVFACNRESGMKLFPGNWFLWSLMGIAAALLLSAFHAENWAEAWHVLAPLAAATVLLIACVRQRISWEVLLAGIVFSGSMVAMFAISGRFGYDLPRFLTGNVAPGRMRTASTLGNPLFVASFLSSAIWAVPGLRLHVAWRVLAGIVILSGMAATTERTALFAVAAGTIAFSISKRSALRQRALVLAIFVLLPGSYASGYFGNPRSLKTTAQGRIFLWKTALHGATFLGHGPGSFYRAYNQNLRVTGASIPKNDFHFINYETDAYNIFVQAFVETGLPGLAAWLIFFAAWFHMAWPARTTLPGQCAIAGVTAFLAAGCCDDPLSRPEGMVLLATWLAVPVLVLFRDKHAIFKIESSRSSLSSALSIVVPVISFLLLFAAGITAFSNYAVHKGEMAEDRGDWVNAERWDRVVLKLDPTQRDAHYNLVRVLAQQEKYQASLAESERALYWVNEAELHIIRIRILPMLGKTRQAQEELVQARKEFPWSEELQQETVPNSN